MGITKFKLDIQNCSKDLKSKTKVEETRYKNLNKF